VLNIRNPLSSLFTFPNFYFFIILYMNSETTFSSELISITSRNFSLKNLIVSHNTSDFKSYSSAFSISSLNSSIFALSSEESSIFFFVFSFFGFFSLSVLSFFDFFAFGSETSFILESPTTSAYLVLSISALLVGGFLMINLATLCLLSKLLLEPQELHS
jgi:hypothetical protein